MCVCVGGGGVAIGGGCTLLKLAAKVDAVKETLSNEEQKVCKSVNVCYKETPRGPACVCQHVWGRYSAPGVRFHLVLVLSTAGFGMVCLTSSQ